MTEKEQTDKSSSPIERTDEFVDALAAELSRETLDPQTATLKQDNDALRSSDLALREQIKALNETIASQAAAIRSMSKPIDRQHKSEHWLNPGTGNIECKCCEQWMADYQVAIEEREEARDTIKKLAESLLYARRNQKGTNGS